MITSSLVKFVTACHLCGFFGFGGKCIGCFRKRLNMWHQFLDQLFFDFHCAFSANVVEYLLPTEEIDSDESVRGYYISDASINFSCFQNVVVALFSICQFNSFYEM